MRNVRGVEVWKDAAPSSRSLKEFCGRNEKKICLQGQPSSPPDQTAALHSYTKQSVTSVSGKFTDILWIFK